MKNIYTHGWKLFILLVIAFIQPTTEAYASHAQGGDLTYTCLGGNQYRLRLAFYRDCAGVNAPANVTIDINSASCNQNLQVTLNPIPGTGLDVTPICPSLQTTCTGGNYPGVQEWIYDGVVTLPQACTDWVFSFTICCRNAAINTIVNPGGESIYIESHLNNVAAPCNNSPVFSNIPVPYVCSGQSFCFNHGAVDPDGDSLSYTLVTPATSPTTNVTYIFPYTASQPLTSVPLITFNNVTGDICMNPTQIIVTVMAVRVDEWRNGILIGSVIRDIQMHTVNCTNALPYISGINGGNSFSVSICAGSTLSFFINSFDTDPGQNISLTWNGAIPGATFTTTAGPLPTGTFTWTPNSTNVSNTPYCFTITVTDDACPYFGSQTFAFCITVTGFGLSISSTATNCGASNGSATVIPTGGNGPYTYAWSPSGGNNANANGLLPGNYTVNVTDANGCTSTATTIVTQGPSNANINAVVTDVQCFGGNNGSATLNVNGGQGPYAYSWSNSATTSAINNLSAGTYTVTVTTANGCTSTATVTVTQPSSAVTAPTIVVSNVLCFGGNNGQSSVNASGGTPPYSYSWNSTPAQTTATATLLPAGIYSVVVTDANGCISTSPITITEPPILISNATSTAVTCNGGSNGSAQVIISGGTPPYSTSWNTTPTQFGNSAVNLLAGNYTATTQDANGCIITPQTTVAQPAPLSAAIASSQNVSCNGGNNGSSSVNVNGGTSPYNYNWNTSPAQFTSNAVSMTAGNYTVTVTDANGCATVSTVSISQPTPVTVLAFADDTICPGQPAIVAAGGAGGTGPYSYNWNNNLGNNSTYVVYPNTLTTYIVQAVDANGCLSGNASITIDVFQFSPTNLTMTGNANICEGVATTVGASVSGNTGSLTWAWTNQVWNSGGPFTVQPTTNTNYQVTVTNQCGVVVTGNVAVVVHPLPTISLSPQYTSGCDKAPLTFSDTSTANNSCNYNWDFGDNFTGTGSNITHEYLNSGNYTINVTIISPFGCIGTASTSVCVTIHDSPIADFESSSQTMTEIEPNFQFTNESSANTIGWQWDFGDNTTDNIPSPAHTYATRGTYNVRLIATSTGGCTDTTLQDVIVEPEFTIYVPNAFTPNDDGTNDVFYAYGNEITKFDMKIFNRWGELISETYSMETGWDGRANDGSTIAQQGVYVYKIAATDFNGKLHHYTGSVTLLK